LKKLKYLFTSVILFLFFWLQLSFEFYLKVLNAINTEETNLKKHMYREKGSEREKEKLRVY
jgi:hypothetical protein